MATIDFSGRIFSLGTLDSAQWVEADNGFNVAYSATTDSLRLESNTYFEMMPAIGLLSSNLHLGRKIASHL